MNNSSPLQVIEHPLFKRHNVEVLIKRDDLIHPIISGNKWRKLKYNLEKVIKNNYKGIVSFGGAYSNHIHALAFACFQSKVKSIGIIRGEAQYANNFTLQWASHWGMQLNFVDRITYKKRNEADFLKQLQIQYPDYLIIPEGGSNALALPGVGEVIGELNQECQFDTLLTPVGSGGTLAGLISADNNAHQLLGVAVLKQTNYLEKEVLSLLKSDNSSANNWRILSQFHRGGYGKFQPEDLCRIRDFSQQTQIPFEPVYSGKMLLALLDLLEQGFFPPSHKIVLLHTGGIQGLGGLAERKKIKADEWPLPPVPPAP